MVNVCQQLRLVLVTEIGSPGGVCPAWKLTARRRQFAVGIVVSLVAFAVAAMLSSFCRQGGTNERELEEVAAAASGILAAGGGMSRPSNPASAPLPSFAIPLVFPAKWLSSQKLSSARNVPPGGAAIPDIRSPTNYNTPHTLMMFAVSIYLGRNSKLHRNSILHKLSTSYLLFHRHDTAKYVDEQLGRMMSSVQ